MALNLPPFGESLTEAEWLQKVAATTGASEDITKQFWQEANRIVTSMGDVFYDPDEFNQACYGCHKQDKCEYAALAEKKPVPPEIRRTECRAWYGESGTQRLLTGVVASIFAGMLLAFQTGKTAS